MLQKAFTLGYGCAAATTSTACNVIAKYWRASFCHRSKCMLSFAFSHSIGAQTQQLPLNHLKEHFIMCTCNFHQKILMREAQIQRDFLSF